MYAFEYHCAQDMPDAERAFHGYDDAKFLAGGQTLLASLKLRLAQPEVLIDLRKIDSMKSINFADQKLTVGALTCHADVGASSIVESHIPALAALASDIGDPAVRNQGTLGGSLANNDPAADYPAAVLALGAIIQTNKRQVTADNFFLGMFETALDPGEVITSVVFPVPEQAAYIKFKHPASRFALVGVFVARVNQQVRVAITGAGACVFRDNEMEARLQRQFAPSCLDTYQPDPASLNSDLHASAEYRASLIKVLTKRAVVLAANH